VDGSLNRVVLGNVNLGKGVALEGTHFLQISEGRGINQVSAETELLSKPFHNQICSISMDAAQVLPALPDRESLDGLVLRDSLSS
jgi:hypothetical protein